MHSGAVGKDGEEPAKLHTDTLPDTEAPGLARGSATSPSAWLGETMPASVGTTSPDYADLVIVDPEHYALDREIARGGMGRIRLARDRRLGRTVAVKEILVKAGDLALRFEREARITARLQHPSIVNIHEAGVWPSGEPFYAMKLVTGRSLDEVVAETRTLDERLALLPNVLAIADAIAYAHGERVIHRDLKPKNVLVGAFGETVVIDWGLAKDLTERSSAPELNHGPFRTNGHDAATEIGDVMGTPQYMPPEQAKGAPVDERADVYAIGAILDHVLAGKPAYTGSTGLEILDAVKLGPPTPLREREPGVPPDLLAIVERAMARDPAARYPTARELAEDLRRYQTGQLVGAHRYSLRDLLRRWLRRHRAAVTVAGVAAIVMIVLGALALQRIVHAQRVAEQQRKSAVASRGDAENLLSFMIGDLREKLQPVGRLDVLDVVANKAADYYDRRSENLSDAEMAKLALARRNIGDVLLAQGHTDGAFAQYQMSLVFAELRIVTDPTSAERQRDVSDSHEKLGDVLQAQGNLAGALEAYQAAFTIRGTMVEKNPKSGDLQRDLSLARNKVADVLQIKGDAAGALSAYQTSLAALETLAANEPTNASRQQPVQIAHERVAEVLFAQGDTTAALEHYGTSLRIAEALVAKDPKNFDSQRSVAVGHEKVGDVLLVQGNKPEALAEFRASLAVFETLADHDPTNANRKRSVAVEHLKVGDVLRAQGDPTAALAEYRAAVILFETLAEKDPSNDDRQIDRAIGHSKLGDALRAHKDTAGALTEFKASLAAFEVLSANDPTNVDKQAAVSASHYRVGDMLLAQSDAAGALAKYKASLSIRETLAAKDPTNADRQRDLAITNEKVGNALAAQRDAEGAIASYRTALAIVNRLVAKDPMNADWQKQAASLATKIEELSSTTKRTP